jgi:hypothetical protein
VGTAINLKVVGSAARNGRIRSCDPATDKAAQIDWHDPARFGNDTTNAYLIVDQMHSTAGIRPRRVGRPECPIAPCCVG